MVKANVFVGGSYIEALCQDITARYQSQGIHGDSNIEALSNAITPWHQSQGIRWGQQYRSIEQCYYSMASKTSLNESFHNDHEYDAFVWL